MSFLKKRRRDYHEVRSHVDPKRLRKQERSGRFKKFLNRVYAVILLGALIWLGYFIFFMPFLMLREVKIVGCKDESRQEILSAINEFLESKRFLIFLQKNYFILDEQGLGEKLNEEFVLSKLEISKDFPRKLNIVLKEKTSMLNLQVGESYYRVDYSGRVIARVDENELDGSLPLVIYTTEEIEKYRNKEIEDDDEVNKINTIVNKVVNNNNGNGADVDDGVKLPKVIVGATGIDEEKVRAVLDLFDSIKEEGIVEVESMETYDFSGLDKKIGVKTKTGYKIFFNDEDDFGEQIDNLYLILGREIKGKINEVEYIDLRFGNKIYYK